MGLNLWIDSRWEEAQREFRRAIELNPSYAPAHQWYAQILQDMGRMKEAMEEIEKAHELDPLSPMITHIMGWANVLNGSLDEAIATYDRLIETEPTWAFGYLDRAYCFALKGLKERAYADLEAGHKLQINEDLYKNSLLFLYATFGEREKALPIVEELRPKVGKSSISQMDVAETYAALGDRDESFNWIDKAIAAKRISPGELRYCPGFANVRDDPRFPEIFKKLGLPY